MGRPVQLVRLDGKGGLTLDEEALSRCLEQGGVGDAPVCLVSIVGEQRLGKSFLLNYLLRRLQSPVSGEGGSNQVTVKMKGLSSCPSYAVSAFLRNLIIFFIIYHIHKLESAQYSVTGPGHPVTAIVGEATVLPCHLSPRMSAENMEVRWFRSEFTSVVHLYQHGKDQYGKQMPDYRGRTELLKAGITDGNVSLQILNIRHSDEGQYYCFVQDGSFYEEALLELKVAALGSNPLVSVESHQDGGIRVVCQSTGWYPEPKVLWRDRSGQELTSLSEAKSLGDSGLFETENSIIIKEHSNQNLSCWIRNTFLNQEKESTVYIADFFFPRVNPWMVALSVILLVLFVSIGLAVYLFKIKGTRFISVEVACYTCICIIQLSKAFIVWEIQYY
ncbi:butyrophilin subfamily 3 member A2-like [Terrapene carolina triunguis]|uniref:butyrophilin subfamily 3 member A2-like n=1 Tax=Terrapene triunguis TaxID=2587831 RepID=UPI0011568A7B|nr:butyrophilin subfamily 3 member A2-like [Terrapene carolina triunguis]